MTHAQLVRRLTALVSNLKQLRDRVDAISLETASKALEAKPKKTKAKATPKRQARASAIGRSIVYGGVKGKVVDRTKDGKRFACKMKDGSMQEISSVYVYRQLKRKATGINESLRKVAQQQEQKTA